ncbi:258_t:CDS:10 [Entrophospora sp. SA101]|nr:8070_t:CDS:10 [Entrophospora sp. SA101]CAJ0627672.1 258_t:CDS:10 [Entrophospora sp. SA101]
MSILIAKHCEHDDVNSQHQAQWLLNKLTQWFNCCDVAFLQLLAANIKRNGLKSNLDMDLTPKSWMVLGPFPTGTREQDFGADPLEAYGGFSKIEYSENESYPSELADNGKITWSKINTSSDGSVGPIYIKNIRWNFNRIPFGWTINQSQMWARGFFTISKDDNDGSSIFSKIPILIQCYNIGDFYIDGERLFGDWYGYKSSWHVMYLKPGEHIINIRIVNETRIFGGRLPPDIKFQCVTRRLNILSDFGVKLLDNTIVVPDLVGSNLTGEYMSVAILNTLEHSWAIIKNVSVVDSNVKMTAILISSDLNSLESNPIINLAPSQQRNLKIRLKIDEIQEKKAISFRLKFIVSSKSRGKVNHWVKVSDLIIIEPKNFQEFYKFTFEDFDGSIQYAMAMPPISPVENAKCPILVALHGAGVEANTKFWLNAYPQQKNAWIVLPTGRTPWGYDWHGPSKKNIDFAIFNLKELMPGVPKDKRHSNGGQGAWFYISHYPDSIIAGTPVAGYIKIQYYVPYYWNSDAYIDPILKGVGIPILARVGGEDDNVHPIHSRMLVRLVNEHSNNTNAIGLSEIANQGHWFDNIMSDTIMQNFLDQHLLSNTESNNDIENNSNNSNGIIFPKKFTITLMNPASFGSKFGIKVDQLIVPYRLGKIEVEINQGEDEKFIWKLQTTNILRFKFLENFKSKDLIRNSNFQTYGPIHQILESNSSLKIIIGTSKNKNNDTKMFLNMAKEISSRNLILLGGELDNKVTRRILKERESEVKFNRDGTFRIQNKIFKESGIGILFLHPYQNNNLALIIAGLDAIGYDQILKLFPKRTGVPVPDWIIISKDARWKGVGGVLVIYYP